MDQRRRRGMHGEGPIQVCGPRARAERTLNMLLMSVTLDVSKLSGWLKTDAPYRVERRAYDAGEMRAGRRKGVGQGRLSCVYGEGLIIQASGPQGTRTWNM